VNRAFSGRLGQNYVLVVIGVVFLALMVSAALRATPGVLMLPLQAAFGWDSATISLAAAIGLILYGLTGPFAAAIMLRFGIRRTVLCALALMVISSSSSALMSARWQLLLCWGLLSGVSTGCVAMVLGATIVNRWFVKQRGIAMGVMTASTATGNLLFLPALAAIAQHHGWPPVVLTAAGAALVLVPVIWWLLPEHPADIGLSRYGARPATRPSLVGAIRSVPHSARCAVAFGTRTSGFYSPPSSSADLPRSAWLVRI
jgi:MFS family permease